MASDTPDFVAARDHVVQSVVWLVRRLRRDGGAIAANAALPASEALAEVGLNDRERVRAAVRAAVVANHADGELFDEHFPEFWYRLRTGLEATASHDPVGDRSETIDGERSPTTDVSGSLSDAEFETTVAADGELGDEGEVRTRRVADSDGVESAGREEVDGRPGTYSPTGDRTQVEDESAAAVVDEATLRRFETALAALSGRRWSPASDGDAIDVRRALRRSMDTGGVTVELPTRERTQSAFRACVLVDVSRSVLDSVDREFLLSLLDGLVTDGRSVRVFFFDTDIREVTDVFTESRGDPASALERAEVAWGGGTRIGAAFRTLREEWPAAVDRRTATVVVSDGLEVGETDDLAVGVSWLARRSRSLIWLNPLATSPAYEPTCRGMETARPYVDGLFAFGGNDDLDEAARQLVRHGPRGPVGYQYDHRDREVTTG